MIALILLVTMLLSGWMLALSRKGWAARTLVMVSLPLGAILGGSCGFIICRCFIFPFDGRPEGQHNWIGWVDAGLLGAVAGLIFLRTIAMITTQKAKNAKGAA